jgi:hypothetical protein
MSQGDEKIAEHKERPQGKNGYNLMQCLCPKILAEPYKNQMSTTPIS